DSAARPGAARIRPLAPTRLRRRLRGLTPLSCDAPSAQGEGRPTLPGGAAPRPRSNPTPTRTTTLAGRVHQAVRRLLRSDRLPPSREPLADRRRPGGVGWPGFPCEWLPQPASTRSGTARSARGQRPRVAV